MKSSLFEKFARFIVSCVYVGYFPVFRGTVASLVALSALYYLPLPSLYVQLLSIACLTILGVILAGYIVRKSKEHDPSWIVIDEVVGMWIAVLLIPKQTQWYVTAFLLFRILDITKWCGVGYFERFKGGWGIMLDDIAAGLLTLGVLTIFRYISVY